MLKVLLTSVVACSGIVLIIHLYQEFLIFHAEYLPPDYKYNFPGRFSELMWDVDGVKINALHFRVDQPKGVILYFHGNAGSLHTWGDVASDFTRRGYDVLIPDYRGYGKSTGKIKNEEMLHQDASFAYRYLRNHYKENEIVIYGRSLGSGLATYLAKSSHPRMLILETPFFNFMNVAHYHYPFMPMIFFKWFLRYKLMSNLWIPEVTCPVYLFHGTADQIVPYESSIRLMKLIKAGGKLVTIEGGGHNDLSDFIIYHVQLDKILS
jgi:uncharacterized protein